MTNVALEAITPAGKLTETNLHRGSGLVRGDMPSIRRTIPGIPLAITVTAAYLTVKSSLDDADASAVFQKSITSVSVSGQGQIENTGAAGTAVIRFDLTETDTLAPTAGLAYYFDIALVLSSGQKLTPEWGYTSWVDQVTRA